MLPNIDDAVITAFLIVQSRHFYIVFIIDFMVDDVLRINDFDGVYRLKFIQISKNPLYLL